MTGATTSLLPNKPSTTPSVITIPAPDRTVTRRSAQNPNVSIYAFVVRDKNTKACAVVSVSLKRHDRFMGLTLKGHAADIVDLEFLRTTPKDEVHVLASCDVDGVVYLWFVYVATDALGIDIGLRLLKKYSFYSLRRSKSAFYSRVRLAGSVEGGTMILVPNDGSSCRVVTFNCETSNPLPDDVEAIEWAPEERRLLTAPEEDGEDDIVADGVGDSSAGAALAADVADAAAGEQDSAKQRDVQLDSTPIEGNTVGAMEVGDDVEMAPPAISSPYERDTEEEVVTAEGKQATEQLTSGVRAFKAARATTAAAKGGGASAVEGSVSVSEDYVDALSSALSAKKEGVQGGGNVVGSAEAGADIDLREREEEDEKVQEFIDPEIEGGRHEARARFEQEEELVFEGRDG
ncbi:hypothetical protein BWQ96_01472 [Gracilariopsis chorda]|uniref:Uncharacterized protein n=1 Tax=Gracilariopsis chorda TaxID=448386 RepID=A0A2V3J5G7_9FLOR|nr:hypothetical protein BWQ96_01472 [Gracilariopsis chorda]|eukprot:PXF48620.1 hypothetical protein BWQ96_01472 [Gracilariopsis chorda]